MKVLYTAIILFMVMIAVVVVNYIYINRVCDRMYVMASQAPGVDEEGCYGQVSILDDVWQENQKYVCLSVSYVELNQIGNSISSMKAFAQTKDAAEFENARRILLNTIREVRRLESFTVETIF